MIKLIADMAPRLICEMRRFVFLRPNFYDEYPLVQW